MVFANTQDTVRIINQCYQDQVFNLLIQKSVQDQDEDKDDITREMVEWYDTSTNSNLDRILTAFEQQQQVVSEIIVPLHNNGHFVMLHVILPYKDKKNGGGLIYDYLPKETDENNLISKMWWAKFVGIFYQKQVLLKYNTYMGVTDMGLDGYNEGFHKDLLISSSLDHGVLQTSENCTQKDEINCGVFTLLVMMIGSKGEIQQIQRAYPRNYLKQCCLRFFNLINDIFKVVVPQTRFYYNWEEHGVVNNLRRWRQIAVESIAQGYTHKKRRNLMKDVKIS